MKTNSSKTAVKRHLTELEEIMLAYPHLEYDNGSFFQEDDLIEVHADVLLEAFYDSFDEFNQSGRDYIRHKFAGDYEEAWKCIMSYSNIDKL